MRILAATLVAAALLTSTLSCSSGGGDTSTPAPTSPTGSVTPSSTSGAGATPVTPSTDPPDVDPDGDGFKADDGILSLSTSSRGTSCFSGDDPDYGWFDAQWRAHTDLDSLSFRLEGATGVKTVGSPRTIPPVNFGGRIDYGGMIEWNDKSPLATDSSISWSERQDTFFYSAVEDESGLLLFHLRFAPPTVAGKQRASLGDLVAEYTGQDGTIGTVTLAIEEHYGFGKNC